MATITNSLYPLDKSELAVEIERLEWQHYNLCIPLLDHCLLPADVKARVLEAAAVKADGDSPGSLAVADVGTGTGIWLVDLAAELPPTAQLDGFDLNTAKFRPPTARPPNVHLQFGDALQPAPPADLCGRYDLVHVRLLFLALQQPDDWRRVAAHARALLRPGGWLVWEEIDVRTLEATPATSQTAQTLATVQERLLAERGVPAAAPAVVTVGDSRDTTPDAAPATPAATAATGDATTATAATTTWYPRDLDQLLASLDFTDTALQTFSLAERAADDPVLFRSGQLAMRFVLQAYLYGVLAAGGVGAVRTPDDVTRLLAVLQQELDSGVAKTTHSHVRVVGRKAL